MYKRAYILQLGKFDIETHNSNQSKKERTKHQYGAFNSIKTEIDL